MEKFQLRHPIMGQSCQKIILYICLRGSLNLLRKSLESYPKKQLGSSYFLVKLGHPETDIVKKLEEGPSQVSTLDLILSSEAHHQILLKVLGKAHLPKTVMLSD